MDLHQLVQMLPETMQGWALMAFGIYASLCTIAANISKHAPQGEPGGRWDWMRRNIINPLAANAKNARNITIATAPKKQKK